MYIHTFLCDGSLITLWMDRRQQSRRHLSFLLLFNIHTCPLNLFLPVVISIFYKQWVLRLGEWWGDQWCHTTVALRTVGKHNVVISIDFKELYLYGKHVRGNFYYVLVGFWVGGVDDGSDHWAVLFLVSNFLDKVRVGSYIFVQALD